MKLIEKEQECGISFLNKDELQFRPNDVLVCYQRVAYQPKLEWNIRGFA